MKPNRNRVNSTAGDIEMVVLEALGGQAKGIEELVAHFLLTYKSYKKNKKAKTKTVERIVKELG